MMAEKRKVDVIGGPESFLDKLKRMRKLTEQGDVEALKKREKVMGTADKKKMKKEEKY